MAHEYEMAIRPAGQGLAESVKSTKSRLETDTEAELEPQKLPEREVTIVASDGKSRSKWRLTAIVIALFVGSPLQQPTTPYH